jgi:hypothetical protein
MPCDGAQDSDPPQDRRPLMTAGLSGGLLHVQV